jgi:hypothetical protein
MYYKYLILILILILIYYSLQIFNKNTITYIQNKPKLPSIKYNCYSFTNNKKSLELLENTNNFNNKLVFYTCFFGNDTNYANVITPIPSTKYDCYYFTNNQKTLELLKDTKWTSIFVDIPIKNTCTENAMDAKDLKARPNSYDILNKYEYTCYLDSKLEIDGIKVENLINTVENENILYIICKHPYISSNVWDEYNTAINYQNRYFIEKDKYYNYINKQLSLGLSNTVDNHYQTGFIIRKTTEKTMEINELWYEHIKDCGIECQISFFFIQQIYKNYIHPILINDVYK